MKVCCVQMNVCASQPDKNFSRVERLLQQAARRKPDVILLPELWNTGFAPGKIDHALADDDGARTKAFCGAFAKTYAVNLVAGSVLTRKNGAIYNTAYVFDRKGDCIAEYDKTHLFSPSGEKAEYAAGDRIVTFPLDGIVCGIMICYDLRFGELTRVIALTGAQVLLIPAEWPQQRIGQLRALLCARAIENQMFALLANGCGEAFGTRFGGRSAILDPMGNPLAQAGRREKIICATLDFAKQDKFRRELPVFLDRRPELYGAISHMDDRQ